MEGRQRRERGEGGGGGRWVEISGERKRYGDMERGESDRGTEGEEDDRGRWREGGRERLNFCHGVFFETFFLH